METFAQNEIWSNTPDGQAICALICGDLGWLVYLRHPEDAGFSSRNPSYNGPGDAEIEYVLSNGQVERYPASWALPIEMIQSALEYFKEHQRPPPFVSWHNDSGDGTMLGNDA
jgi:hypothetical protein